jgi:hypothetical protein
MFPKLTATENFYAFESMTSVWKVQLDYLIAEVRKATERQPMKGEALAQGFSVSSRAEGPHLCPRLASLCR